MAIAPGLIVISLAGYGKYNIAKFELEQSN
jgi:hypothetical protein